MKSFGGLQLKLIATDGLGYIILRARIEAFDVMEMS